MELRAAASLALSSVVVAAAACSSPRPTTYPYPIDFQNDTSASITVTGCPGCGGGHAIAARAHWLTGVNGGLTQVFFVDGSGRHLGCVHMVNGALPPKGAPPQQIAISQYIPCRS